VLLHHPHSTHNQPAMRASTVLSVTGVTLVTGFLGYAVYFDYKRRNDPAFRTKLRKDKKRTSKELKRAEQNKKKQVEEAIQRTVEELSKPGALPSDVEGKEQM
jgi:import receptor subunit TOM20